MTHADDAFCALFAKDGAGLSLDGVGLSVARCQVISGWCHISVGGVGVPSHLLRCPYHSVTNHVVILLQAWTSAGVHVQEEPAMPGRVLIYCMRLSCITQIQAPGLGACSFPFRVHLFKSHNSVFQLICYKLHEQISNELCWS